MPRKERIIRPSDDVERRVLEEAVEGADADGCATARYPQESVRRRPVFQVFQTSNVASARSQVASNEPNGSTYSVELNIGKVLAPTVAKKRDLNSRTGSSHTVGYVYQARGFLKSGILGS